MSEVLTRKAARRAAGTGDGALGARIRERLANWTADVDSARSFRAYFFLSAGLIILIFLVYAQIFVVEPIRHDARKMIERYAFFYRIAASDTIVVRPGPDLNIVFETITETNFPMVIADKNGTPMLWKSIGVEPEDNSPEAQQKVRDVARRLALENKPYLFDVPLIGPNQTTARLVLYYGDSALVKRLSWLPVVSLLVTILFIGAGYLGFRHIRTSEQRSIWVGMARETAHQLGTPLSSLYGWLELLKAEVQDTGAGADSGVLVNRLEQTLTEMEKDTNRLNKIASRFSQIGSTPELRMGDLGEIITETAGYLRDRLSRGIQISVAQIHVPPIPMNRELLGWALENLLKNAADAMEGRRGGRIEVSASVRPDREWVDIRVWDNGKGIAPHLVRRVFLPGYSTKKRGWGLGLAFVKRIVEEYHMGRIVVAESTPGVGTTFLVSLPIPQSGDRKPG